MKKTLSIIGLVSIMTTFLISPVFGANISTGEVSFDELGTSEPAILIGNPFYRLKDFRWGVVRFFTSSADDLALKQSIFAEKAAEVKKVISLNSRKTEVVLEALNEYQSKATTYKIALLTLAKNREKIANANEALIQAIVHMRLIDEAMGSYYNGEIKTVLLDIESQLAQIVEVLAVKMVGIKNLSFKGVEGKDLLSKIRDWETMDLIASFLEEDSSLSRVIKVYQKDCRRDILVEIGKMADSDRADFEEALENLTGTGRWIAFN